MWISRYLIPAGFAEMVEDKLTGVDAQRSKISEDEGCRKQGLVRRRMKFAWTWQ